MSNDQQGDPLLFKKPITDASPKDHESPELKCAVCQTVAFCQNCESKVCCSKCGENRKGKNQTSASPDPNKGQQAVDKSEQEKNDEHKHEANFVKRDSVGNIVVPLTPDLELKLPANIVKPIDTTIHQIKPKAQQEFLGDKFMMVSSILILFSFGGCALVGVGSSCMAHPSSSYCPNAERGGIIMIIFGTAIIAISSGVLGFVTSYNRNAKRAWYIIFGMFLLITYGMLFGGGVVLMLYYTHDINLHPAEVYFQVATFPLLVMLLVILKYYIYLVYQGQSRIVYPATNPNYWKDYKVTYYFLISLMGLASIMVSFSPLMPCFYRVHTGIPCCGSGNDNDARYIIGINYIQSSFMAILLFGCWYFWLNHFTQLGMRAREVVVVGDVTARKVDKWGTEMNEFLNLVGSSFTKLMALFISLLIIAGISSVLTALSSLTKFRIVSPGPWLQFVLFACGVDLGCIAMLWSATEIEQYLSGETGRLKDLVTQMYGEGRYDEIAHMQAKMRYWSSRYKGVSFMGINFTKGQFRTYVSLLLTQPALAFVQDVWNWCLDNFSP